MMLSCLIIDKNQPFIIASSLGDMGLEHSRLNQSRKQNICSRNVRSTSLTFQHNFFEGFERYDGQQGL